MQTIAVEITAELRHAGLKTEMSYGRRSAKAQMKQANNSGAHYAVILKSEELAEGFLTVKNLQAEGMDSESKQVKIKRTDLLDYINNQHISIVTALCTE